MTDYDDNRCQGCGESQAQGYKCGACGARLCKECDARYGFCAACHHDQLEQDTRAELARVRAERRLLAEYIANSFDMLWDEKMQAERLAASILADEPAPAGDCKHEQITYAAGGYFCDRCGEMVTVDAPAGDALAGEALGDVLTLRDEHRATWRDKPESYWLARLMQEVGELGSSLVGDHDDPPEWELRQIAAICLNWLDMRHVAARKLQERPDA